MDVPVTPKLARRRTPRALPSLLGRGLPERLRSTSLALTGVVAAACLGMIGLTLQHGLPLASSGPIHEPVESDVAPAKVVAERNSARQTENGAASARPVSPAPRSALAADDEPIPVAPAPSPPVVGASPDPKAGGRGDDPSRPPAKPPAQPSPAPTPSPAPAEDPVATPSRELPDPAPEEPAEEPSTVPGKGHAYGKGGGGPEGTGPPGLAKK